MPDSTVRRDVRRVRVAGNGLAPTALGGGSRQARRSEFVRTNFVITAVWAAAFAVTAGIDLAWLMVPTLPPRVVIIVTVLALLGAVKFTGWYPDHDRAVSSRTTSA